MTLKEDLGSRKAHSPVDTSGAAWGDPEQRIPPGLLTHRGLRNTSVLF